MNIELVRGLGIDLDPRPHMTVVIGSGISCSHGRCAVRPSANAAEGYTCSMNGICPASPANARAATGCWRHHEIDAAASALALLALGSGDGRLPPPARIRRQRPPS